MGGGGQANDWEYAACVCFELASFWVSSWAIGHEGHDVWMEEGAECGVIHAERGEDVLLHVFAEFDVAVDSLDLEL